jgi:hypothetical protein
LDGETNDTVTAEQTDAVSEDRLYIPYYFPAYPKATATIARTIQEAADTRHKTPLLSKDPKQTSIKAQNVMDPALKVRSALISLDKNDYWGSAWQETTHTDNVVVPPGRPERTPTVQLVIEPLAKASGSRVSKILEGSMEPPAAA